MRTDYLLTNWLISLVDHRDVVVPSIGGVAALVEREVVCVEQTGERWVQPDNVTLLVLKVESVRLCHKLAVAPTLLDKL